MAIEEPERDDIEQRYLARDFDAAATIAAHIEDALMRVLPFDERLDAPVGVDAYDTPYEPNVSLYAIAENGDLTDALLGKTLQSFVTLTGAPLDDADPGEDIVLEVHSHALNPFSIQVSPQLVKQVKLNAGTLPWKVRYWIEEKLKHIVHTMLGIKE